MNQDTNPHYSPTQWVADFHHLFGLFRTFPVDLVPSELDEYFYQKYPDDPFGEENYRRLKCAWSYYQRHKKAFDEGDILVYGDDGSLVHRNLLLALYRIFAALPVETLDHDFKTDLVMRYAREQAQPEE